MKKEIADRLRGEYEWLWDDSMSALPDGWTKPLVDMLEKLYALSTVGPTTFMKPGLVTWVNVQVEVSEIVAIARATPLVPTSRWNGDRAMRCMEALYEFAGSTGETCSVCGEPGALRLPNFGHPTEGVLCNLHLAEAQGHVDRAKALYDECRVLFPAIHGKSINLAVPDYLEDLLAKCLRDTKQIVEREGLVGDVIITLVEMREGMLFVWHRHEGKASHHIAAQADIGDIMRHLQLQAEKLWLEYGGSDAS